MLFKNGINEAVLGKRGTVRKAVDLLQERGYVQKIHGKGVFVLKRKNIEFNFGGIVSFQEENERLGRDCITKSWK